MYMIDSCVFVWGTAVSGVCGVHMWCEVFAMVVCCGERVCMIFEGDGCVGMCVRCLCCERVCLCML